MMLCKKLLELPAVVAEWQQDVKCPDCGHYALGRCCVPDVDDAEPVCPLDAKGIALRVVPDDEGESQESASVAGFVAPEAESFFGVTEQALRNKIMQRTGGRIQALAIEVRDNVVAVTGRVVCFHHKQLALQGILDVLGVNAKARIELNVEVEHAPLDTEPPEDPPEQWKHLAASGWARWTRAESFTKP